MVLISFPDTKMERKALGFLAKRFPLTRWASGQTLVPEPAMTALATEGIVFTVEGRLCAADSDDSKSFCR